MEESYPLTLQLEDEVYEELKRRAARANRTVEEEIISILEIAFPPEAEEEDELSSDALDEMLASLPLLGNEALWSAAQSHQPQRVAAEIESLTLKQEQEGLTEAESAALEQLKQQLERLETIRGQAIVLLKERGYDISGLND
jgi:plasmid stability protein